MVGSSTTLRRSSRARSASCAGLAQAEAPVAALGITNQRETTVVWDRSTAGPSRRPSSGRTGARRMSGAALREGGHEEAVRARTGLGNRSLLFGHQDRLAARPHRRRAGQGRRRRTRLRHDRQLAGVAAHGRAGSTPRTPPTPRAPCCSPSIRAAGAKWLCLLFGAPPGQLPEVRDTAATSARPPP
jgi:hypothetical protein